MKTVICLACRNTFAFKLNQISSLHWSKLFYTLAQGYTQQNSIHSEKKSRIQLSWLTTLEQDNADANQANKCNSDNYKAIPTISAYACWCCLFVLSCLSHSWYVFAVFHFSIYLSIFKVFCLSWLYICP